MLQIFYQLAEFYSSSGQLILQMYNSESNQPKNGTLNLRLHKVLLIHFLVLD